MKSENFPFPPIKSWLFNRAKRQCSEEKQARLTAQELDGLIAEINAEKNPTFDTAVKAVNAYIEFVSSDERRFYELHEFSHQVHPSVIILQLGILEFKGFLGCGTKLSEFATIYECRSESMCIPIGDEIEDEGINNWIVQKYQVARKGKFKIYVVHFHGNNSWFAVVDNNLHFQ